MFKKLKLRCLEVRNSKMNNCGEQVKEFSHNALSPYRPHALTPLAKAAFTMAEILLSLTIIGVVAAITLPSLTGNINERTWNTQRKALHSRLSQAAALMPQIRGYGTLSVGNASVPWSGSYSMQAFSSNNATEAFITNGLAKVFKLNNICDSDHITDCGIPAQTIPYGGGSKVNLSGSAMKHLYDLQKNYSSIGCANYSTVDTLSAAFETANGESILVHYNPLCKDNLSGRQYVGGVEFSDPYIPSTSIMCANFIYDLNGKKGPNTMGKDMGFMTLFYPTDSVLVSPDLVNKSITFSGDWQSATQYCKGLGDDARLPNMEELASLIINDKFLPVNGHMTFWSSTKTDTRVWAGWTGSDTNLSRRGPAESLNTMCIRRSN